MSEGNTGPAGVMALVLVLLGQWSAIAALPDEARPAALLAWYDACVHFSDVVLLQRREGVANKWVSDFLKHHEDQLHWHQL